MGIKNLRKAIRRFAKDAETRVMSLSELENTSVAVDANIFAWKSKATQTPLEHYFAAMIADFERHNIRPVFVWDGMPHPLKQAELDKRKEEALKSDARTASRCEELDDMILSRESRLASTPKSDFGTISMIMRELSSAKRERDRMVTRSSLKPTSKEMFRARCEIESAGFSNVIATHDGEHLCATMVRRGFHVVVSEDMDTLAYGASVLTGYTPLRKYPEMFMYNFEGVLHGMSFTRQQFVEYCILCGSDLCCSGANLKGIGMVRAKQMLTKYGSIDAMMDTGKFTPTPGFTENYTAATRAFLSEDVSEY